jgi:ferredoxin-nitrite reductase
VRLAKQVAELHPDPQGNAMNKVEQWKTAKHGFDVWPDVLQYAAERRPMSEIDDADLVRMKWYGAFYRKRDGAGTYMLRIRVTGGEMTSQQAKAVAYVAYQYGYGIVDVTTRSNLQVQGLSIDNVPKALAELEATGLNARQTGHDNVRNVFGHPLSGVDPDELIDTRGLCREITQVFLDDRRLADLPRKFNIAVNGTPHHALHYWSQDLSLLAAEGSSGTPGFQVLVGGTQGQNPKLPWHLPVWVAPQQVGAVTRSLLELFRQQGSREKRDAARFRFLIEKIGVAGVLDWLESTLDFPLEPCVAQPQPPTGYDELVGWFRQKQAARWAMGLCVPLGRLSWQQMEALGVLAKKWGDGTLRTTPEQGVIIPNIATGFRDAAATDAAACGLSPYADTLLRNTVACTGKQFCNIAVTETKGHMLQLVAKLRERHLALHGIRIHMSGCPSSCAQHFTADIGLKGVRVRRLLGTREGFDVYLGGGIAGQVYLGAPYKLGVDVHQLPQLIEEIVREYYLAHKPGQTFSSYWREKIGASEASREAAKVGDAEYTPPVWLCDVCNYAHEGEDPPVYCPKCAGLRRNFARVEADDEGSGTTTAVTNLARRDGFIAIARVDDVPADSGLAVTIAGRELALFRAHGESGKIVAVENICPHEGAPLAGGSYENGVVTCPIHAWTFRVCDGCSVRPKGHRITTYATRIEGDAVLVNLTAQEVGETTAAVG